MFEHVRCNFDNFVEQSSLQSCACYVLYWFEARLILAVYSSGVCISLVKHTPLPVDFCMSRTAVVLVYGWNGISSHDRKYEHTYFARVGCSFVRMYICKYTRDFRQNCRFALLLAVYNTMSATYQVVYYIRIIGCMELRRIENCCNKITKQWWLWHQKRVPVLNTNQVWA